MEIAEAVHAFILIKRFLVALKFMNRAYLFFYIFNYFYFMIEFCFNAFRFEKISKLVLFFWFLSVKILGYFLEIDEHLINFTAFGELLCSLSFVFSQYVYWFLICSLCRFRKLLFSLIFSKEYFFGFAILINQLLNVIKKI